MTEDLLDHWIRIIKPLFPAHAWIGSHLSGNDYLIQIDWKRDNCPQGQNKRSKKIEIIIKEESIDDYLNKNRDERSLSDIKMKQWISERYDNFSRYQDADTSNTASPDRWRISRGVLSL